MRQCSGTVGNLRRQRTLAYASSKQMQILYLDCAPWLVLDLAKCWTENKMSSHPFYILPVLYSLTGRGMPSNLVPEPRSWVWSCSVTHFRCANSTIVWARSPYGGTLLSSRGNVKLTIKVALVPSMSLLYHLSFIVGLVGDLSIECWTISEMPNFPHQLKVLGATGRCRLANMVSKTDVSNSNPARRDLSK
jgi:hypothetical protein